ncbi:hypothetical protein O6B72_09055 [Campylobacter ureolyticus]|uniref:hypothetical protein n=1 Tax=Campylobacter ureolyticus TaxID=827 RepID=UPI0022B57233|nr:hypothetical protein [Campylobacter ureolyticus]MCZ6156954.1 hypothetical protein [Campylobacter ureolyticus]
MVILFRDLELELGSEPLNGLKIFSEEKYTGSNGGVNFSFSLYDMFSPFFTDKNFLNYQFGRQQVDYGFGNGIEIIKKYGSFDVFLFQYKDKIGYHDKTNHSSNDISNLSYLNEFREFLNYDIKLIDDCFSSFSSSFVVVDDFYIGNPNRYGICFRSSIISGIVSEETFDLKDLCYSSFFEEYSSLCNYDFSYSLSYSVNFSKFFKKKFHTKDFNNVNEIILPVYDKFLSFVNKEPTPFNLGGNCTLEVEHLYIEMLVSINNFDILDYFCKISDTENKNNIDSLLLYFDENLYNQIIL